MRIDETSIGALGSEEQVIKFKLPPKYSWGSTADVEFTVKGGLTGSTAGNVAVEEDNKRTLTFDFDPSTKDGGARGSIFIEGLKIVADRDAPYGDVVLDVDGDEITADELVVAQHLDYNVDVSVEEVKELVAGMWDQKTAEITIEETLEDSLVPGRKSPFFLSG